MYKNKFLKKISEVLVYPGSSFSIRTSELKKSEVFLIKGYIQEKILIL